MNIAILGAGAWGTALAVALARRHPVRLWARDSGQCAAMRASRENVRYLPGVRLPEAIALSDGLAAALDRAELVLVATPLSGFRQTVRLAAGSHPGLPLLWLCKGLESGSGLLPHQVVAAEAPGTLCGALTGPSFAEEVADGRPTALSLAAAEAGFDKLQHDVLLRLKHRRRPVFGPAADFGTVGADDDRPAVGDEALFDPAHCTVRIADLEPALDGHDDLDRRAAGDDIKRLGLR